MIHQALLLLSSELENYFKAKYAGNANKEYVALGNIAQLEADDNKALDQRIILTLVNIEEESTLKNLPNYTKTINGGVRYENPPVYLNLYLLFTANFPPNKYFTALQYISTVIEFFQGQYVFNLQNAPKFGDPSEVTDADLADLHLILNMYTLTFEQINHLWGSLGGKQGPFTIYKARLVRMVDRRQTGAGPLIEEVNTGSKARVP